MNERLKEYLRENEQVRWESKAKAFSTLGGKYGKKFAVKLLVAIVVAAAVIVGHLNSGNNPKTGLIALVAAVVAYVAVAPFLEKNKLMKIRYWITDQRVIVLGSDKLMRSMELGEIDSFKVEDDGGAKDCLVLGSSVFQDAEKSMRWRTISPKTDEGKKDHALGLILYNVENVKGAVDLLKAYGCARVA